MEVQLCSESFVVTLLPGYKSAVFRIVADKVPLTHFFIITINTRHCLESLSPDPSISSLLIRNKITNHNSKPLNGKALFLFEPNRKKTLPFPLHLSIRSHWRNMKIHSPPFFLSMMTSISGPDPFPRPTMG